MTAPLVYLVAGEPSGDLLGARLMAGLKEMTGGAIAFAGIGGEAMRAQGMTSLFPQADLAVMGVAEVIPRIPLILKRLSQTVADVEAKRPAVLVTIDSWGFTGRLAMRLKERGSRIPRVHYVAPMVWAWKEKRALKLARCIDLLMCLLPNEPPFFERVGLPAVHVGHPVLEGGADKGDGAAFRQRHGLDGDAPILCVLPGSRHSETSRLLGVFGDTAATLAERYPGLSVVVPTVETVAEEVRACVASWPMPVRVVHGLQERYDAFAASRAALAASGTVALELALAGVPMAIGYRVAPLTAFLARLLLKVRYVCLLNLLMDRAVVPEFLQEDCRTELLVPALAGLLDDGPVRQAQLDGNHEALIRLGLGGESPSRRAAAQVLRMMRKEST